MVLWDVKKRSSVTCIVVKWSFSTWECCYRTKHGAMLLFFFLVLIKLLYLIQCLCVVAQKKQGKWIGFLPCYWTIHETSNNAFLCGCWCALNIAKVVELKILLGNFICAGIIQTTNYIYKTFQMTTDRQVIVGLTLKFLRFCNIINVPHLCWLTEVKPILSPVYTVVLF